MSQVEDKINVVSSQGILESFSDEGAVHYVRMQQGKEQATEHLHRRIASLSTRIRQLEDALSTLHAKHSSEPHPLLHADLLNHDDGEEDPGGSGGLKSSNRKAGLPGAGSTGGDGMGQNTKEVLDAFGTLSISEHGISRFFGPTGGSESLLIANLDAGHSSPQFSATTPDSSSLRSSKSPQSSASMPGSTDDLVMFSQSFPFTPMGQPADVQVLIESHLPPYERTLQLCETYFAQVSWLFRGVTRMQLIDEMLPAIYHRQGPTPPPHPSSSSDFDSSEQEDYSGPHDLALLFMVLAIGSLVGADPSDVWGEHFHQVGRAAVSLQPVLEKPSIVTIQTLHLMSIYNAMSGSDLRSDTSMEMTWSLITLAAHLSQTIGLHRDSARWGLSPKMVQRRRILFWDLFVADVWQSLNTGRPPSFSLAYIDCGYPEAQDVGSEFGLWQIRFAAECVAEVTSRTLTAEAPSYATIMELDKKVRDFPLPDGLTQANNSSPNGGKHSSKPKSKDEEMTASFQRCVLDHIRETILLYIHRSFFAQSIIEHPINPLKSTYAPSFLAAYRASSTILKSVKEQFHVWPTSCSRFWVMWTFAFSAAVVFGTVVTRGPRSPLASSAMTELDQACALFAKASLYSIRATKALPILTKLNEKARQALSAAQHDIITPLPPFASTSSGIDRDSRGGALWHVPQTGIKQEETDDELSIFAGHTRFVHSSARKSGAAGSSNSVMDSSSPQEGKIPSPPILPLHPNPGSYEPALALYPVPSNARAHPNSEHTIVLSAAPSSSTSSDQYMAASPPQVPMELDPQQQYGYTNMHQGYHHPSSAIPYQGDWQQPGTHDQPERMFPYAHTQQLSHQNGEHPHHPQHPQHQQSSESHSQQQYHIQPPEMHSSRPNAHYVSQYQPGPPTSSTHTHPVAPILVHSNSQSRLRQAQPQQIAVPIPPTPVQLPSPPVSGGYPVYSNNGSLHPHPHPYPEHSHNQHHSQQRISYSHHQHPPNHHPVQHSNHHAGAPPNMDLADLGLASRDSRLDERWGTFMAESGLLEDFRRR
ncbi:hypothetical protein D9613_012706 [Agrocybe pediades]|uniref:Xylanolytic transcriptional activator regulatory domain-containing protein n=1 Tax=Agrocybe pediades TaxID=84607 RepID=A0A8H4QKJ6_9AGAR|nr:hypothetical protein D9613_012706 [Agrocybe pediades]